MRQDISQKDRQTLFDCRLSAARDLITNRNLSKENKAILLRAALCRLEEQKGGLGDVNSAAAKRIAILQRASRIYRKYLP